MFRFLIVFLSLFQLASCVGTDLVEDFVEPELRIGVAPDTIGFGESYQFDAAYFNNVGQEDEIDLRWSSSDQNVITISTTGLATAVRAGSTVITATADADGITISDEQAVSVGQETVVVVAQNRTGNIRTTSSYRLTGDFEISEISDGIRIDVMENYEASTALPGLYVYLTNNPNTTSGAFEIGKVETFEGAHFYELNGVSIDQYSHLLYFCKPFNVKVGDAEIENQ